MFRIDTVTNAVALPTTPATGTPGYFTEGNPNSGTPATRPGAYWFNMMQEEMMAILAQASIAPAKGTHTQIRDAILAIIAASVSSSNVVRGVVGLGLSYVNTTTVTILAGSIADDTGVKNLILAANQNVVITNTGANGSQTGAAPTSAPVYIYLIGDNNSGTNGANGTHATATFMANSATPTLPNGYDVKKLIGAVTTNSSAQIRAFSFSGQGSHRELLYDDMPLVLNNGSQGTFTAIAFAAYLPISLTTHLKLNISWYSGNSNITGDMYLRKTGSGATLGTFDALSSATSQGDASGGATVDMYTDASGNIDYKTSVSTVYIHARGFEWEL